MKNIKLIALDVDGVLTDGKLLIGPKGIEYKSFHVKDGMGISLARSAGIKIAWITGRHSEAVLNRANELNIDYLFEGITDKTEVLYKLIDELNISLQEVFYMGDDINDLPVMKIVGFSAAPSDAVNVVKNEADLVCCHLGGNGAVREAIDLILSNKGDYQPQTAVLTEEQYKLEQ